MFRIIDLGSDVAYEDGLARMRAEMARVDDDGPALVFLEHRPTLTVTKKGGTGAFLSAPDVIAQDGIDVAEADRGGDVTFHGPGQLTGYPLLRLGPVSLGCDVVGYVRALESALVDVVRACGVDTARAVAGTDEDGRVLTGVWAGQPTLAKVCAIGVGLGGGVTRHGFALNVTTDLARYTRHIVPCGIAPSSTLSGVTSLARLLPQPPVMAEVKARAAAALNGRLWPWHRPLEAAAAPAGPPRTGP